MDGIAKELSSGQMSSGQGSSGRVDQLRGNSGHGSSGQLDWKLGLGRSGHWSSDKGTSSSQSLIDFCSNGRSSGMKSLDKNYVKGCQNRHSRLGELQKIRLPEPRYRVREAHVKELWLWAIELRSKKSI